MSLSSLSKAKIAFVATAGATIIAEIGMFLNAPKIVESITLGLGIAVALVGIWLLTKASQELRRTIDVCKRIDDGDFEVRLIGIKEGGDLGEMQKTINSMIDRCDAYIRESMACQEYVAQNKYFRVILPGGMKGTFLNAATVFNNATKAIANKVNDFSMVADDFERNMKQVVDTVAAAATELQSTAKGMETTAHATSQQATTVAAAAEEASSNVQTVASAAEELSSSISEISRQVAQSTHIAGAAVAEVDNANEKVQGLAEAAQKIGEVVALITDIADQTNLLALNATIEAARAGEAGKGFAVVASEVKNLANATAKATEEISAQIGGIQTATQDAVAAIGSIGGTIAKMNEIASAIAAAVEEQGAATQEIARNVEQAAAGTQDVSSNIILVTQAANETGHSAGDVLSASGELAKQAEILGTEMDNFVVEMRKVV